MTIPSLNIAWSIAEIETSSAGFESIRPNHFWIGCCKACDLDLGKFLQSAPPEIQAMELQVSLDFKAVREALAFGKVKPATLRRALRSGLGKQGDPTARPLHRHQDLRAAFTAGKNLAEMAGGSAKPVHVLFGLLRSTDTIFDECLAAVGGDRNALAEALENSVLAEGFAGDKAGGGRLVEGERQMPEPAPQKAKPKKQSVLAQYGRNLNQLAMEGKLAPVIGRKAEMLRIVQTLLQSRKNNVILVGEPGVGKTGIVDGGFLVVREID